jgi:hypothetical protein
LLAALAEIPDPRRPQGTRYPLAHLLLFSVLAVLAGATSYRGIVTFLARIIHRVGDGDGSAVTADASAGGARGATIGACGLRGMGSVGARRPAV